MRKAIYDAPIEEKLRDLIRSCQMALECFEAGLLRGDGQADRERLGLAEDEFAICDWIVRPRFKDTP